MVKTKTEFAKDIENLLISYFDKTQLKNFIQKLNSIEKKSSSLEVVDKFYAQQLNIEYNFAKDRMEIDRTITFAMKNLEKGKYLQLLRKLGQICTGHGKINLAFEVLNKAVKETENNNDKAESLLLLSDVYSRKAEWKKSIEVLNEAKILFDSSGNNIGTSKCENLLGSIYGERGQLEEAKLHFEISLSSINPSKEKEMAASIETNLGIIENIQGNYTNALDYFLRALRKFESLGSYRRLAELKHNVGMLHVNQKNYNDALEEFNQCIGISLKEELLPVLGLAYLSKANVLTAKKDFENAHRFADKSMEVCHQIDDNLTMADIYKTKSLIEKNLKNYEKAENYLQSSLRLNQKMNNILNIAETSFELANLYGELNRMHEKEEYLRTALKCYREVQASERIQQVEEMLSTDICN